MLSIIIPVLNESETIEKLLLHLLENASGNSDIELIIVDGGSQDNTINIIREFDENLSSSTGFQISDKFLSIQLISSKKGRAKQMNKGARYANGNILYFLHADSLPPKNFNSYIFLEFEKSNFAGCFRMKFDSNHWWLNLAGWLTKFKWQGCRGGDQSLFISKKLFDEIGGFDEKYIIYEDNIIIDELYKRNEFVIIPYSLITSARRYKELGVWRLQYHFWTIHLKKWLGADAQELYNYYEKNISLKS